MLRKPGREPRSNSAGVRMSMSCTDPSRGSFATSSQRYWDTSPKARFSTMKPAMFTGSFAEE